MILDAVKPFAARDRARVRRRALRRRWIVAAVLPLAFASCVDPVARPQSTSAAVVPATAMRQKAVSPQSGSLLVGLGQNDRMRATLCLASAVYYEAATESDDGQRAVAQVVLNRVRHVEWPHTVCGVVYEGSGQPGCQFSFACDGAMARTPSLAAWIRARRVAEAALAGQVYEPVGSATFYHTTRVVPGWRTRMVPVGIVGAHIFYRLPGDAPDAASLPVGYRGGEPAPGPTPGFAFTEGDPSTVVPIVQSQATRIVTPGHEDRTVAEGLPQSGDIRPEWRDSGKWIDGR